MENEEAMEELQNKRILELKEKGRQIALGFAFLCKVCLFVEVLFLVICGVVYGMIYLVIGFAMLPSGGAMEAKFLLLLSDHVATLGEWQMLLARVGLIFLLSCGALLFLGYLPSWCATVAQGVMTLELNGRQLWHWAGFAFFMVIPALAYYRRYWELMIFIGFAALLVLSHDFGRGLIGGRFWIFQEMTEKQRLRRTMRKRFLSRCVSLAATGSVLTTAVLVVLSFSQQHASVVAAKAEETPPPPVAEQVVPAETAATPPPAFSVSEDAPPPTISGQSVPAGKRR